MKAWFSHSITPWELLALSRIEWTRRSGGGQSRLGVGRDVVHVPDSLGHDVAVLVPEKVSRGECGEEGSVQRIELLSRALLRRLLEDGVAALDGEIGEALNERDVLSEEGRKGDLTEGADDAGAWKEGR